MTLILGVLLLTACLGCKHRALEPDGPHSGLPKEQDVSPAEMAFIMSNLLPLEWSPERQSQVASRIVVLNLYISPGFMGKTLVHAQLIVAKDDMEAILEGWRKSEKLFTGGPDNKWVAHAFGETSNKTIGKRPEYELMRLPWWEPGKYRGAEYFGWVLRRPGYPREHVYLQITERECGQLLVFARLESE